MRFAFVTELFSPSVGGQEHRFERLADGLVARGHSVDVLCIGHDNDLGAHEHRNGIQIERLLSAPRYQNSRIPGFPRSPTTILRFALRVRRKLKAENYDAVLFNQWPFLHIAMAPRASLAKAAIDWCEARDGFPYSYAQRSLPPLVPVNFCINRDIVGRLPSRATSALLPSGVDTAEYGPAPDLARRTDLLVLGRLVAHKNVELTIDAFANLLAEGFEGELIVAGDGNHRSKVESHLLRQSPAVRARTRLLGRVSEEEKRELLASAAVLVISSEREGFPNVVVEAMASGLPVATAPFHDNGTAAIVRDLNIGVVACGTEANDLAQAIVDTFGGRSGYAATALSKVHAFTWNAVTNSLESVLTNLAETGKPDSGKYDGE